MARGPMPILMEDVSQGADKGLVSVILVGEWYESRYGGCHRHGP